ncbi:hypothetical protein NIES4106_05170 [Fischerella sp. NIES-4106]|jgi:hypothetical protein|nr:hypothetical protein NIES4106_05170 [Fischerella sp. NIES-4106]
MQKNVKNRPKKFPIMRLFKRQYLWMPTTLGWGMIITVFVVIASFIFLQIHSFLVINSPLQQSNILVQVYDQLLMR